MNYLQPPESLLQRVYQAQLKYPIRGDWASETAKVAEKLEIQLSHEDIKNMNRNQLKNMVKKKSEKAAFRYLCEKQENGKKANI